MPGLCVVVFYVWKMWRCGVADRDAEDGPDDGADAHAVRRVWWKRAERDFGGVFGMWGKADDGEGEVTDGKNHAGDAGG